MADLDVRRLLLLKTVAEHGSLTAAADVLMFTTSAVSQQISKLEKEAGLALVERHARGVRLTEAGEALVSHAERIDQQLAAARSDMDDFSGLRRGELEIGTFPTVGASLLPQVIVELRRRHPQVGVRVTSHLLKGLVEGLLRHQVDLALLWDYAWDALVEDDLVVSPLMEDPTVVLLPTSHPLASRRVLDIAALADEDWVTRSEHVVASVLMRVTRAAGFTPRIVFSANDYPEVQGMVAAGLGVALAPRLAVLVPRDDVKVVALKGNPAPRRILLAHARERRLSPSAAASVSVFRGCAARLERTISSA